MLPTILSQLRAENFSSALKKLATSGGWFSCCFFVFLIVKQIHVKSTLVEIFEYDLGK